MKRIVNLRPWYSLMLQSHHLSSHGLLNDSCTSANLMLLLITCAGHTAMWASELSNSPFCYLPERRILRGSGLCFLVWIGVRRLKPEGLQRGGCSRWRCYHCRHEWLTASEMTIKMWSATPPQSGEMDQTTKWAVFTQVTFTVIFIYTLDFYFKKHSPLTSYIHFFFPHFMQSCQRL